MATVVAAMLHECMVHMVSHPSCRTIAPAKSWIYFFFLLQGVSLSVSRTGEKSVDRQAQSYQASAGHSRRKLK